MLVYILLWHPIVVIVSIFTDKLSLLVSISYRGSLIHTSIYLLVICVIPLNIYRQVNGWNLQMFT